jgi:drug/metabolite transporter superfamily protein YnfA
MVATAAVLGGAGHFLHWGWFSIGLSNLLIILGMILLFVLALVVPFPGGGASDDQGR